MKKEGSDLKIMEEMERKKLQDRYIRFDWAIKRLLRQKANFDVLDGFLTVMLNEEIKIVEILESEGNQESADDKFNRVDIKALNSKGEIILVEIQNTRELHYLERIPLRRSQSHHRTYLDWRRVWENQESLLHQHPLFRYWYRDRLYLSRPKSFRRCTYG